MKKWNIPFNNAFFPILCVLILTSISISQEQSIRPNDAQKYIGEEKTVCGVVASTAYAIRTKGQPTFLNLDQPYPNQVFTVVIWGSDRTKFNNNPEIFYKEKTVCVTGKIKSYKGRPEIIVNDPSQINIIPKPTSK